MRTENIVLPFIFHLADFGAGQLLELQTFDRLHFRTHFSLAAHNSLDPDIAVFLLSLVLLRADCGVCMAFYIPCVVVLCGQ